MVLPNSNQCTTYFVLADFGTILSAILCLQDQPTPLFKFGSLLLNNHALQIGQNYSTKVEVSVNHMISVHVWTCYTYLSLGFFFHHEGTALETWVASFPNQPTRNRRAPSVSWRCKISWAGMPSFTMHRSCPWRRTWTKPCLSAGLMTVQASLVCDIRENQFLAEQVELIKKIGNHLTNLCRLAGHLLPVWAKTSSKGSLISTAEACRTQTPLRGPSTSPWCQDFCLSLSLLPGGSSVSTQEPSPKW